MHSAMKKVFLAGLVFFLFTRSMAGAEEGKTYCFRPGEGLQAVPLLREGMNLEGYRVLPETGGDQAFVLFRSAIGETRGGEIVAAPVAEGIYRIFVDTYTKSSAPVEGVALKCSVNGALPDAGPPCLCPPGQERAWQLLAESLAIPDGAELVLQPVLPETLPDDFEVHVCALCLSTDPDFQPPRPGTKGQWKTDFLRLSLRLPEGRRLLRPPGARQKPTARPMLKLPPNFDVYKAPAFSFSMRRLPDGQPQPLEVLNSSDEILQSKTVEVRAGKHAPAAGIYEVCMKIEESDASSPSSPSTEERTVIAIADRRDALSVSLFTDRNRSVFFQGESIVFHVAIRHTRTIPGGALELCLLPAGEDQGDGCVCTRREEIPQGPGPRTASFRLATVGMKPGDYAIEARFGKSVSRLPFTLVPAKPRTTTKIFLNAVTAGLSDNPSDFLAAKGGPEALARFFQALHINRIYDPFLFYRPLTSVDAGLEATLVRHPELGAEEQAVVPDRYREELLRAGVSFGVYPIWSLNQRGNTFVYSVVNDAWREELLRTLSWYTRLFSRAPNFVGFDFFADSGILKRYWTNPEPEWDENFERIRARFRAESGLEAPTEEEIEAAARAVTEGRPLPTDSAKRYLDFQRFGQRLIGEGYGAFREMTKKGKPDIENTTANNPGGRLGLFTTDLPWDPGPVFESLDAVSTWYFNEWHGIFPSAGPFLIDLAKARFARQKPVYATANFFQGQNGPLRMRAELFLLLSRGVDGVGFNPTWPLLTDTPREGKILKDALAPFFALVEKYGDFLMGLEPRKEVAVLYSPDEDILAGPHLDRAVEIYDALLRNHYAPAPVFPENIRRGDLKSFRALVVPGYRNLPQRLDEDTRRAIADFESRGGIVLEAVEGRSSVSFPGARKLDFATGLFRKSTMPDFEVRKRARETAAAFRETIGPPADSLVSEAPDTVFLVEAARSAASGAPAIQFLWVINDRVPPFGVPPFRLEPQIVEIELSRVPGAVYDVFSEREAVLENRAGRTVLTVDLTGLEARLFAFCAVPIARPEAEFEGGPAPGEKTFFRLTLLAENGAGYASPFPAEVRIVDPGGRERFHFFPCAGASARQSFSLALNDPAGEWTLEAREEISGKTTTRRFAVGKVPERRGPSLEKVEEPFLPEPGKVKDFFNAAAPILIVCDIEALRPDLVQLVEIIERLGGRCTIKRSQDVPKEPRRNSNDPFPHFVISATDGTRERLILAGWPDNNPILKELSDGDALPQRLSPNYPGPETAVIQFIGAPFHTDADAILVCSRTATGIREGLKKLRKILEEEAGPQERKD
jgi:hypothetical protein